MNWHLNRGHVHFVALSIIEVIVIIVIILQVNALLETLELKDSAQRKGHFAIYNCSSGSSPQKDILRYPHLSWDILRYPLIRISQRICIMDMKGYLWMDIIMDIKGYLFMVCKDIFIHARYSGVYPFISFMSSNSFIDILHFILTYPIISCFFILIFILIYPHLIQPLYPAIYPVLSWHLSCWFFDPVLGWSGSSWRAA